MLSASSLKQSAGRHVSSLKTHYPDSEQTNLRSYFLMLGALQKSNKYQFYSLQVWPDQGSNQRSTAHKVSMHTFNTTDLDKLTDTHNKGKVMLIPHMTLWVRRAKKKGGGLKVLNGRLLVCICWHCLLAKSVSIDQFLWYLKQRKILYYIKKQETH